MDCFASLAVTVEKAESRVLAKLGDDLDLAYDCLIEGRHFFRGNPVL
jgi:hypothetical protein